MLASTMQHSTHNHTPTHQPPPHPPTHSRAPRDALDGPGQEQPEKTPTGVSSGPNSVPNPRNHKRLPTNHESIVMFHPATPTKYRSRRGIKEKENQPLTTTNHTGRRCSRAGRPHHTVRLLRKEVIQPHLPVRLPCYDFVPIASPTFDNSLPRRG
jgi:hypothetical protein